MNVYKKDCRIKAGGHASLFKWEIAAKKTLDIYRDFWFFQKKLN